ncbi:hypothetical protein [Haloferula sp. A504]|uniref:hypothetical protein n=1 Tax=Haloferula sp. A504 TaxID=3373601 RepID=UPI0031BDF7FA|nr:fibronectin type III domain-containing protein [Verrucomicrobiaceae bacterium E54]
MNRAIQRAAFFVLCGLSIPQLTAQDTLKVFLLAGQSNMEGHAYTYTAENPSSIPTLEYLVDTPGYLAILPAADYSFKGSLAAGWINPRSDAWAVQYDSDDGTMRRAEPTPQTDQGAWSTAILPFGPGFGNSDAKSSFGPELGMGIYIAELEASPILLVKSNRGGRSLAVDFRPPSAVEARGGNVGPNFTNTVNVFSALLDDLDADLGDNGVLDGYNNATGYEVCGFVWLQGWNDALNANMRLEYEENLVDLVHDIRASDPRIPADLPVIVPESADQNAEMNVARANAVAILNAERPGTAVIFENNNLIGNDWTAQGYPFTLDFGSHFNGRAENYLEVGWRVGKAVVDNGYLDSSPLWLDAPEVLSTAFDGATLETSVNLAADELTIYWDQIDRGATSTGWGNSRSLGAKGAGTVTAVLGDLSEYTDYVFRFHATNASLPAEAWSAPGSFQTPWENPPPLAGVPITTAIFNDGATVTCALSQAPATATAVVWAYDDQGESDVATWQSAPGGGSASLGAANPGDTLSHTINGLDATTSYTYRFYVTGATGYSWSEARSFPTGATLDGVITPIEAVAANFIDLGRRAEKLIDGSGLSGAGDILTQTHSEPGNTTNDYFLGSATDNEIVFTLPATATVGEAHIWQYDRAGNTSRGIHTFDISFSTDGGVTYPTTLALTLEEGTGAPTPVQTRGFTQQSGVTHIRFDNIVNYGDASWIGLSEVRFGVGGPLQLDPPDSSNVQFDRATVSTGVNEPVDTATLYWDTVDHGPGADGWTHSVSLGPQAAGAIDHLLTGLSENTGYFFRFHVESTVLSAEAWSEPGSFSTPFQFAPPMLGTPSVDALQTDGASVSCLLTEAAATNTVVVWAQSDQGESDVTTWEAAPGGGSATLGAAGAGDLLAHTITGLDDGTAYAFRFQAVGAAATVWSPAGSFTTLFDAPSGPILAPSAATATNSNSNYPIIHTIDSSGLNDADPDILNWTHDATPSNTNDKSWLGTRAGTEIVYELPGPSTVGSLYYWSYWGGVAGRSLTAFDISFSSDGVTYSTPSTITLGTPGSAAEFFSLGTHANVTHVRFTNLQNGGDSLAGIGEVRFGAAGTTPADPYGSWAAGPWSGTLSDDSPTLDSDGGGLETGIEWVVSGDPTDGSDDPGNTPTYDNSDPSNFIFTFKRRDAAAADANTGIAVEYGSNLTGWAEAVHGTDGVIIDDSTDLGGGFHQVTVSIPRMLAVDGKLFARLKVTLTTAP